MPQSQASSMRALTVKNLVEGGELGQKAAWLGASMPLPTTRERVCVEDKG